MGNLILSCALMFGGLSVANCGFGGPMLGPGRWYVMNLKQCPEQAEGGMVYELDIRRHKINRTHDGFSGALKMADVIDDSFAIRIDVCKHVDGGCKPYQVITDDCFERFVKKYAGANIQSILEAAKIDPPDFPVPSGTHEVQSYVFNYDELPENGMYGLFGAKMFIVKGGRDLGCVDTIVRFARDEDD